MSADHRDLALAQFAADEAELLEHVVALEADVVVYRMLTYAAIAALRDVTVARDRLRASHHRLIDEYRHLRERTMRQAAAA